MTAPSMSPRRNPWHQQAQSTTLPSSTPVPTQSCDRSTEHWYDVITLTGYRCGVTGTAVARQRPSATDDMPQLLSELGGKARQPSVHRASADSPLRTTLGNGMPLVIRHWATSVAWQHSTLRDRPVVSTHSRQPPASEGSHLRSGASS